MLCKKKKKQGVQRHQSGYSQKMDKVHIQQTNYALFVSPLPFYIFFIFPFFFNYNFLLPIALILLTTQFIPTSLFIHFWKTCSPFLLVRSEYIPLLNKKVLLLIKPYYSGNQKKHLCASSQAVASY